LRIADRRKILMREALHKFTDEAPRIVNVTGLPDLLRKA
jgi:hypothetical protein